MRSVSITRVTLAMLTLAMMPLKAALGAEAADVTPAEPAVVVTPPIAAAPAAPATPVPAEEASTWRSKIAATVPFVLKRASVVPPGFSQRALEEPFSLSYSLRRAPDFSGASFILDANVTFPRYSLAPAVGVAPGISFGPKPFLFEVALDVQNQQLVDRPPFRGSQFDVWITSLLLNASARLNPHITLGVKGRIAALFDGSVATFEGLETRIEHQATYVVSPWIALLLPLDIELGGQVDLYSLGSAAIASKEVAIGLKREMGARWAVSLGRRLGPMGIEARYRRVTGFTDEIALPYQAPFYYRDYLLTPQSLTLEASWHL